MDITNSVSIEPISRLEGTAKAGGVEMLTDEDKKKAAKDFESLLIYKLLQEMTKTIGQWGFDKDGASQQVNSLFDIYLSQNLAKNGGFGLWKQIYKSMNENEGIEKELSSSEDI